MSSAARDPVRVTSPFDDAVVRRLRAGDHLLISGVLYTARDAVHKRLVEALRKGEAPPVDLRGQSVYYVGPTPARPGRATGSAGPTTSGRMDRYTPFLLAHGLRVMIGKGQRSVAVRDAIREYGGLYLAAVGGAGALIAGSIKESRVVAYEDLGTEAIYRLEVEDFPAIVVNDVAGGDLYEEGKARYRRGRASDR